MNRRKFITYSAIAASVPVVGIGVYEILNIFHFPDYKYLLENKSFIAEICETIIPATDTPGAKEAKVEEYIVYMVKKQMSRIDSNKFIEGLKGIEEYSRIHFKKSFVESSGDQKIKALKNADSGHLFAHFPRIEKFKQRILGINFIDMLKSLTVIGYCTSEIGATVALAYVHIPVEFQSCIQLRDGQRSWATK